MEAQSWAIAQIVVDILMVALLLWFLRSQHKRHISWQDYERVIEKSETVLSEMGEISRVLDRNLQEKRDLSHQILEQLDQGLKRAENSYRQISEILPKSANTLTGDPAPRKEANRTRSSVLALLKKGLSKEEIAKHLGISVGEIELLVKLRPQSEAR
jgi:hypothetical protein